jgi:uncharacterized RmlC-like cupin family protein
VEFLFALVLATTPVDTCRFDLPGTIHRNADGSIMVQPLLGRAAVDSVGVYSGWLFLAPGHVVTEHEHDAEEMLWVVCGSARLRLGEEEIALVPGASVRIPRGTPHAALAGAEGVVAVQVYRPGTPGLRYYDWSPATDPPR